MPNATYELEPTIYEIEAQPEPIEIEPAEVPTAGKKEKKPHVPTNRKNIESEDVLQARADEALANAETLKEFCGKYGLNFSHVLCGTFIHSTLRDPHSEVASRMAARLRGYLGHILLKRANQIAYFHTPAKDQFKWSIPEYQQEAQHASLKGWILNESFHEMAAWLLCLEGLEYLKFFSAYCKFNLGLVARSRLEEWYKRDNPERMGLSPVDPKDGGAYRPFRVDLDENFADKYRRIGSVEEIAEQEDIYQGFVQSQIDPNSPYANDTTKAKNAAELALIRFTLMEYRAKLANDDNWRILWLSEAAGLTFREIGEMLGLSEATARQRHQRALTYLQQYEDIKAEYKKSLRNIYAHPRDNFDALFVENVDQEKLIPDYFQKI